MRVIDYINSSAGTAFSFEVLPPLKGTGTGRLFGNIDRLMEFNPGYINITTHHSEPVYQNLGNGTFKLSTIRRRPGTVAVATAIQKAPQLTLQRFCLSLIPRRRHPV